MTIRFPFQRNHFWLYYQRPGLGTHPNNSNSLRKGVRVGKTMEVVSELKMDFEDSSEVHGNRKSPPSLERSVFLKSLRPLKSPNFRLVKNQKFLVIRNKDLLCQRCNWFIFNITRRVCIGQNVSFWVCASFPCTSNHP